MEMTKYPVDADILENSYVDKMAYANFLFEQERNTIKLNAFISECLCIAEGGNIYDGIKAINEGISDKAESAWDKVMDFLRRMWGKFVENMTRLFNSNGYYLEKYKDIILKKPLKFTEKITMPNYFNGIKNIVGVKIPQITVQSLERVPLNTEDGNGMNVLRTDFMKAWNNGKPSDNPEGKEFKAWAVDFFKGLGNGEVDFTASQINMTDVYNFCHDSKNITSILEKDKAAIERASKEFADEVKNVMTKADKDGTYSSNNTGEANDYDKAPGNAVHTNGSNYTYTITVNGQVKSYNATSKKGDQGWGIYLGNDYPGNKTLAAGLEKIVPADPNYKLAHQPEAPKPEAKKEGTPSGGDKGGTPAASGGAETPKKESTYSNVYGRYITENDNNNSGNTNTGGNNGTTAAAVARASSANANTDGRYKVNNAVDVKSTDKTIQDKANTWLGVATEVITAKMTAVEAINKSFMQIIKNHVQYYVGKTDIENDQAPRQGTDYNSQTQSNNNQQNTQQNTQPPAGEKTGGQPQPAAGGQPAGGEQK